MAAIRQNLSDEDRTSKVYLNDEIPVSSNNEKITVNNITYSFRYLDCLLAGLCLEDANVVKVKGGLAFFTENAWLSYFFPVDMEIQGMKFHSAEQAYQYTRAMRLGKPNLATMIYRSRRAKEAKMLGYKTLSNEKWDNDKIDVMRTILTEFHQHPELCSKLIATGQDNLIEATVDGFWGANAVLNSKSIKNGTWSGSNVLRKILCELRDEIPRELVRKHVYARLRDGLHPGNVVLESWAYQLRVFHYTLTPRA